MGEQSMANVEEIQERRPWRVNEIIRAVSKASGVPVRDITGPLRAQEIVSARHAVMWIARQQGCWSYPQIGRLLGNRDHTTVLHGVRKAEKRLQSDDWFRWLVAASEAHLTSENFPTLEAVSRQVVKVEAPESEIVWPALPVEPQEKREPTKEERIAELERRRVRIFSEEWWELNELRGEIGFTCGYAAEYAARMNGEAA